MIDRQNQNQMKLTTLLNLVENCMIVNDKFHLLERKLVNYKFRSLERKIVKKNFA